MTTTGFSVRGVEHLRERFSKRTREVKALTEEFSVKKGRRATKREIEVLVRESRAKKLSEITTREVRERQRAELTPDETHHLDGLVRQAMSASKQVAGRVQPNRSAPWSQRPRLHVTASKEVSIQSAICGDPS